MICVHSILLTLLAYWIVLMEGYNEVNDKMWKHTPHGSPADVLCLAFDWKGYTSHEEWEFHLNLVADIKVLVVGKEKAKIKITQMLYVDANLQFCIDNCCCCTVLFATSLSSNFQL